jgi:hypothetical protein
MSYKAVMYITEVMTRTKSGKVSHRCILLRESFRKNGKTCNRTLMNLTHCKPEEVAALRLALKHKHELENLEAALSKDHRSDHPVRPSFEMEQGASVGAVWTVYQVARRLGIETALGADWMGKLALWQVIARVIEQGSRLSAVRLAQRHAACDVLGICRGFDENDLYDNLAWLTERQPEIEDRLFAAAHPVEKPDLYLYDVTSSYLEGEHNELAAFGYNRDGKRGKKQLVIGLLCDHQGCPVSIEVFVGNTSDPKTFGSQIRKAADRFGARNVTLVGDRGMIKTPQIEELGKEGFHYITAITKPQIEKLLDCKLLQMELFDTHVAEVKSVGDGARYILRRNPVRAAEMAQVRQSKLNALKKLIEKANDDLAARPRTEAQTRLRRAEQLRETLKLSAWTTLRLEGRRLELSVDEMALSEEQKLDGCYVIKTDLDEKIADRQTVHDRYKDLTLVEQAFRSCKTVNLEMRPVHVVKETSTRGHALVVMLAYHILRHVQPAWIDLDITPKEAFVELSSLCAVKVIHQNQAIANQIPKPRPLCAQLLKALDIQLPEILPFLNTRVVTRKKLSENRKNK